MYALGLSAFYHDSAAALIKDGTIVAAVQEERFSRVKNDPSFPQRAVAYCLEEAGIGIEDVACVAFYEDTHLKFDRIARSYIRYLPRSLGVFRQAMADWLPHKIKIEQTIQETLGFKGEFRYARHHVSHAASAFYPSPFERAAILIVDGVGEWASTSIGVGEGHQIRMLKEICFPHSLGMLYSAFTQFAGFAVNSGEYKLMGLAPYGKPIYRELILDRLLDLKEDGSYRLNLRYLDYHRGRSTINRKFEKLMGAPARAPDAPLRDIDANAAASIQAVFNETIARLATSAKALTGSDNLVLAGGVALNSVANGHVAAQNIFDGLWAQPAAGDAGGALGCALYAYYHLLDNKRVPAATDQGASLLGPSFTDADIHHYLHLFGVRYDEIAHPDELNKRIAQLLAGEKIIGLFQGRMEFGPRALGARSIIADPRSEKMHRTLNLRIKYRESFRPFAPAVLKEHAQQIFDIDYHSPYMQFVVPLQDDHQLAVGSAEPRGLDRLYDKRSQWPAITHVDYSARVQLVDREENPRFYALLERFYQLTGCPLLINTSFNVRGEPIVCTPEDALRCFFGNDMDILVLGNFIIDKEDQDIAAIGRMYHDRDLVATEPMR